MANKRTCEGCGCTEDNACIEPKTGRPCAWIEGYDGDLCTACGEIAVTVWRATSPSFLKLDQRDCYTLLALLDELNIHLESAIESNTIPGTDQIARDEYWPSLKRDMRLRARSEEYMIRLTKEIERA